MRQNSASDILDSWLFYVGRGDSCHFGGPALTCWLPQAYNSASVSRYESNLGLLESLPHSMAVQCRLNSLKETHLSYQACFDLILTLINALHLRNNLMILPVLLWYNSFCMLSNNCIIYIFLFVIAFSLEQADSLQNWNKSFIIILCEENWTKEGNVPNMPHY